MGKTLVGGVVAGELHDMVAIVDEGRTGLA